jgi:hypothetical protein
VYVVIGASLVLAGQCVVILVRLDELVLAFLTDWWQLLRGCLHNRVFESFPICLDQKKDLVALSGHAFDKNTTKLLRLMQDDRNLYFASLVLRLVSFSWV